MGANENKAAMRRIFEDVINGRQLELVGELYTADHELHPDAGVGRGADGMKEAFADLHGEFPDVHAELHDMVAEGDLVAVRTTFSGTRATTGERAQWLELVLTRFAEGRAAESWEIVDTGRDGQPPAW